ncbi:MAG: type 1 periplasmic binding fold superfamily protein [Gemmatimonadetes bacterium]|nr:type 1 periplasmic binding fold superfamily protein [Gemmatimonadota bacterium]
MLKYRWNILSVMAAAVFTAALTFSCADDNDSNPMGPDDPEEHEEDDHDHDHGPGEVELITTLRITLTPQGGGAPVTAQFQDLDGEGGNAPVVGKIVVNAGTVYDGVIQELNETESPPEDITEEVKEEAEAHQLFFHTLGGFAPATVAYADKESDYVTNSGVDHPVGVRFTLTVPANARNGQFRIVQSHYDDAPKDGVTPSDETDIEVTFEVEVRT